MISEVYFFTFHCPGQVIFRKKKEIFNFRIPKCNGKRNRKNLLLRNTLNCITKIFGKIKLKILCPLQTTRMTEQKQILLRHLECISTYISRCTLDSLKSVFNVFRRNLSLRAPDSYNYILGENTTDGLNFGYFVKGNDKDRREKHSARYFGNLVF